MVSGIEVTETLVSSSSMNTTSSGTRWCGLDNEHISGDQWQPQAFHSIFWTAEDTLTPTFVLPGNKSGGAQYGNDWNGVSCQLFAVLSSSIWFKQNKEIRYFLYPELWWNFHCSFSFLHFICKIANIKLTLLNCFNIKLDDTYKVTISHYVCSINYYQEIFTYVHTVARIESSARFPKKHKTYL